MVCAGTMCGALGAHKIAPLAVLGIGGGVCGAKLQKPLSQPSCLLNALAQPSLKPLQIETHFNPRYISDFAADVRSPQERRQPLPLLRMLAEQLQVGHQASRPQRVLSAFDDAGGLGRQVVLSVQQHPFSAHGGLRCGAKGAQLVHMENARARSQRHGEALERRSCRRFVVRAATFCQFAPG